MHLPEEFEQKMRKLLGEDYDNYAGSFAKKYGQTFRVNQLKTQPADFFRRFAVKPVPWCENGFYYDGEERLSLHPFYYGGAYYIQEPCAMAPASFLPVKPGDKVLDLCAAPGGKTTALAAKLQGQGVLIANDISISRCKALLKNMEMAGVKNALITCETPERLAERFAGYFDCVLVDAPCSGEGMFRKEPSMAAEWSPEEVRRYSDLQKEILGQAASMVRPGGYLLYSTCTYSPEEDEQVVETLLRGDNAETFRLESLPLYPGVDEGHPRWSKSGEESLRYCRRFWNHRVDGEGQFAALFKKEERPGEETGGSRFSGESSRPGKQPGQGAAAASAGTGDMTMTAVPSAADERTTTALNVAGATTDPAAGGRREKKRRKNARRNPLSDGRKTNTGGGKKKNAPEAPGAAGMSGEMRQFFEKCRLEIPEERLQFIEERVFLLPENCPDMQGLRVVRSGLYLGDCKKKRFEPGQALAMALRPEDYENIVTFSPEDIRVEKYLRGETVEAGCRDGWVLICVDGLPLGWGKSNRGNIKNKIAPGWRKM